jgi:hypothetical protein
MSKNKKYKWPSEEALRVLINKELALHKVTYEDVLNEKDWYHKYTFNTREEYLAWKKFCLEFLSKQVTPKINKKFVEQTFNWLDLQYGLRYAFDPFIRTETSIEAI